MTGPLEYRGVIEPRIERHVEVALEALVAESATRIVNARACAPLRPAVVEVDAGADLGRRVVVVREYTPTGHPSAGYAYSFFAVAFTADEWAAMRDALQALEAMA